MRKISRALVTGGAGFIGSHLVDELLRRGIETFVLDNLSTGSIENLRNNRNNALLKVRIGNIRDIDTILSDIEDIDVVFHEAAIASVPKSVSEPMLVHDVNVNHSLRVLNFCLRKKVRKFVFASSAAVYGAISNPPAKEDLPCSPFSPYGASKMAVENYLNAYYNTYGLETVALRYFNVYGPRQQSNDYSGVITIFINHLIQNEIPTIFGDGGQTRDFVHVSDVVQANMLVMESQGFGGESFNVASGNPVTILELFQLIADATGSHKANPRFMEERQGDVRLGIASISKIERTLGYRAKVSLGEGLSELAEYLKRETPSDVLHV